MIIIYVQILLLYKIFLNLTCTVQIILKQTTSSNALNLCTTEQIYFKTTQDYIIKLGRLYIANPSSEDELLINCPNKGNSSEKIKVGLNIYQIKNTCSYETSELQIFSPAKLTNLQTLNTPDKEIELINNLFYLMPKI